VVLDILDRKGGAVRMTIGYVVRKEFKGANAVQRVSDLVAIYDLLLKYGVPYRSYTRSGGSEHRRRRVRIGRVQLAMYKIG
jgi:hypothetical protein